VRFAAYLSSLSLSVVIPRRWAVSPSWSILSMPEAASAPMAAADAYDQAGESRADPGGDASERRPELGGEGVGLAPGVFEALAELTYVGREEDGEGCDRAHTRLPLVVWFCAVMRAVIRAWISEADMRSALALRRRGRKSSSLTLRAEPLSAWSRTMRRERCAWRCQSSDVWTWS